MDNSNWSFGTGQIENATPAFAQWIFRGYFIISKAIIGWIGGLVAAKAIDLSITTLLFITLTISLLLDPIMLGFSKLFGVVPEQIDPAKPFVASQQVDKAGATNAIPDTVLAPQQPAAEKAAEIKAPVVASAPVAEVKN